MAEFRNQTVMQIGRTTLDVVKPRGLTINLTVFMNWIQQLDTRMHL